MLPSRGRKRKKRGNVNWVWLGPGAMFCRVHGVMVYAGVCERCEPRWKAPPIRVPDDPYGGEMAKDVKSPYELAREIRALADQLENAGTAKEVAAIQEAFFDRVVEVGLTAAELAAGRTPGLFKV